MGFECLGIVQCNDADGYGFDLGHLRSAESSRTRNNLKTVFGERAHQQRRQNAVGADAFSQLPQGRIRKDTARVGLRLIEQGQRNVAVLGGLMT